MNYVLFYSLFFLSFSLLAEDANKNYGGSSASTKASQACFASLGTGDYCTYSNFATGGHYNYVTLTYESSPDFSTNLHCYNYSGYATCSDNSFSFNNDGSCPDNGIADPATGECPAPEPCQPGSFLAECRVDCPAQDYTYFLNGIAYRGRIGGGQVGYGETCPQPSFPNGSSAGCVGDVGTCGPDWDNGTNDGTQTETTTSTTTTTDNGDGSTTTNTTTTSSSSGGDSAATGAGGSGGGGAAVDDSGNVLPNDGDPTNDWDGDPSNTVDIGGNTYGTCAHGGIVSADGGCDYPSHNCGSNQVDTASGCIDLPEPADLPGQEATTTTSTTTDPAGNTTSTTTTTSASDGVSSGAGAGSPDEGDGVSTGSSSDDCLQPPSSSGDAQLDAILIQNWNLLCAGGAFTSELLTDMGVAVQDAEDELVALIDTIKTDISNTVGVNISLSGSCSQNIVNIFGVPMDFSVCRFLPYFVIAGNVLLAMGAFISFRIIMS